MPYEFSMSISPAATASCEENHPVADTAPDPPDGGLFPGVPWQPGPAAGQKVLVVPTAALPADDLLFDLGPRPPFQRFMACYRNISPWMVPAFGDAATPLPRETQFLLLDMGDRLAALYPLVDGPVRCSLEESGGHWKVRLETGDPAVPIPSTRALLLAEGSDAHELAHEGAAAIAALSGTVRLREERRRPRAAELLGWCSWNAFYEQVNERGLLDVMRQFADEGVLPRFVLLDGGWHQENDWILDGFEADLDKFPNGLSALVQELRGLGVQEFYAWQTFCGYWRGSSPELLGPGNSEARTFRIPERLESGLPAGEAKGVFDTITDSFYPDNLLGRTIFFPSDTLGQLYDAFHRHLAAAGVTGVKIDAMAWMEALAADGQGRVAAIRDMMQSAEASADLHFRGGLIFCSSCVNDCLFESSHGAILRTSIDYLPADPASHGILVLTNAMVSFWTSPLFWSDWDMFQSGHEAGWFHAAARAISGGPVYLTDEPGRTDFTLVRRLRLSDGSLPLCRTPALPTRDSLFDDATKGNRLLKIFAHNVAGSVLGAFNCRPPSETKDEGRVGFRGCDIPGMSGCTLAVWSEKSQNLVILPPGQALEVVCCPMDYDILTVADASEGMAVIGNVNLLNPGGAVASCTRTPGGAWRIGLLDGGTFTGWSRECPRLTSGGQFVPLEWESESGCFTASLATGRLWDLELASAPGDSTAA
jgi:raffinose synthase